jgi:putative Holliday junction resolvase
MRYLAVDYGAKRTGLAICDETETLASPLTVIEGQGGLVERIRKVVAEEGVESIILGLPVNMDGTDSGQTRRVRKLADQWRVQLGIAVVLHDERLSSFEAEKKLAGLGITRKKKKKHIDSIAAAAILESFLDKKHQAENRQDCVE